MGTVHRRRILANWDPKAVLSYLINRFDAGDPARELMIIKFCLAYLGSMMTGSKTSSPPSASAAVSVVMSYLLSASAHTM